MIVFPQLSTGAVAQFPFRKVRRQRTIINVASDGTETRSGDVDFQQRIWELSTHELTDVEWQAVQDLFVQVEGRRQSFLFLEPAANLLSWTEKFSDEAWEKDTGISVLDGHPDPLGGTAAGQLSSSGTQGALRLKLNIPASFRYAGSVWARTADAGASLRIGDGGAQVAEALFDTSNQWKRYSMGYDLVSSSEWVDFEIGVPAGGMVEIFGPQLEAQPAPSAYKKTLKQGGVYPNARFDQDVLADQATDVGRHAGVVRISWTPFQT